MNEAIETLKEFFINIGIKNVDTAGYLSASILFVLVSLGLYYTLKNFGKVFSFLLGSAVVLTAGACVFIVGGFIYAMFQ